MNCRSIWLVFHSLALLSLSLSIYKYVCISTIYIHWEIQMYIEWEKPAKREIHFKFKIELYVVPRPNPIICTIYMLYRGWCCMLSAMRWCTSEHTNKRVGQMRSPNSYKNEKREFMYCELTYFPWFLITKK